MSRRRWLIGLGIVLALVALSPLASPAPDGLERVAEDYGFLQRASEPAYRLIPDYLLPGLADERLATIAAGLVGALVVFALACGLALLLRRRREREGSGESGGDKAGFSEKPGLSSPTEAP